MKKTLCSILVVVFSLALDQTWGQTDHAPRDEAPQDEAPRDEAPQDEAPRDEAPRDEAPPDEAPGDQGGGDIDHAGSDMTCRECRARYLEARERCQERDRLPSDECHDRGLDVLSRCLEECGYLKLEVVEPPSSNPVADPEVVVSIHGLSSTEGKVEFSLGLDTSTTGPFRKLIVGFASLNPGVCEIADIQLGSGLLTYIAQNNEPPACDIVIFPPAPGSPAGAITKLFLDVPYDSQVYGSEYLIVEFDVTANEPSPTTIQLFGEEAYERGREGQLIILPNGCDSADVTALPPTTFLRGDANSDSSVDVSDAVTILLYLFAGRTLNCEDAADFNDGGSINIADAVLLMNALFTNIQAQSPVCGSDETADDLSCNTYGCNA